MAAAPFLIESNLKWNPLLYTPNPIQYTRLLHCQKFGPSKISKPSKLTIKCFSKNHKNGFFNDGNGLEMKKKENPFEIVVKSVMKALKALQKPAAAAVLVGLLLMYDPNSALAASGGRIGGKSFSSRSSSSSRGYSMRRSEPSFSYSVPYYAPSPFGFGGGGVYVGPAVGFGSSAFLVMMGFAAFILVSGFLSDRSEGSVLTSTDKTSVLKLQVGLLGLGRSLQKDLNRIAEVADTSMPEGLSYVLTETTLALLRHPCYCISAYSSLMSNGAWRKERIDSINFPSRNVVNLMKRHL